MKLPKVSIIIPTYNAEKYLDACMKSIFEQDYPKDRLEVFVVDDDSSDSTLEIMKKYPRATVLRNGAKNAEIGTVIGFKESKGDLIFFEGVDTTFNSSAWISEMVEPFVKEKDIYAVECDWGIAGDFNSINAYCALLKIADPLARILSRRKAYIKKSNKKYDVMEFADNQNPILYCVMWRRTAVEKLIDKEGKFEEGSAPYRLSLLGDKKIAHTKTAQSYHYYVDGFSDYINKRKKIAKKYLGRRSAGKETWVEQGSTIFFIASVFYLGTMVGPTLEALYKMLKERRITWLWHPIISCITIYIYVLSFFKIRVTKSA